MLTGTTLLKGNKRPHRRSMPRAYPLLFTTRRESIVNHTVAALDCPVPISAGIPVFVHQHKKPDTDKNRSYFNDDYLPASSALSIGKGIEASGCVTAKHRRNHRKETER
jgi:hypothetical protein